MESFKVVDFQTAKASGRRFRYAGTPQEPSHQRDTGHVWRLPSDAEMGARFIEGIAVKCAECGRDRLGLFIGVPDMWVLEYTEEELFKRAEELLNGIGIKVKDVEVVK